MRSLLQVQPQNKTTATRQTLTGSAIDRTAATAAHCRRGGGEEGGFKGRSAGLLPLARLVNNHQSQEPSAYLMALCSARSAGSLQIISFHIIASYLI